MAPQLNLRGEVETGTFSPRKAFPRVRSSIGGSNSPDGPPPHQRGGPDGGQRLPRHRPEGVPRTGRRGPPRLNRGGRDVAGYAPTGPSLRRRTRPPSGPPGSARGANAGHAHRPQRAPGIFRPGWQTFNIRQRQFLRRAAGTSPTGKDTRLAWRSRVAKVTNGLILKGPTGGQG